MNKEQAKLIWKDENFEKLLPDWFEDESCEIHKEIDQLFNESHRYLAIAASRGFGKSTRARKHIMKRMLYGLEEFIVIMTASKELAITFLAAIEGKISSFSRFSYTSAFSRDVQPCQILNIIFPSLSFSV